TGGVPAELLEGAVNFLAEMPSEEGGLRANTRIPVADLLSTFTGLWTLDQLGALGRVKGDEALSYARALEEEDGGFRAGVWADRGRLHGPRPVHELNDLFDHLLRRHGLPSLDGLGGGQGVEVRFLDAHAAELSTSEARCDPNRPPLDDSDDLPCHRARGADQL